MKERGQVVTDLIEVELVPSDTAIEKVLQKIKTSDVYDIKKEELYGI